MIKSMVEEQIGKVNDPDVRPAIEATIERLEAWEFWATEMDCGRFGKRWATGGHEIIGRGHRENWSRVYPLRSADPWDFATWAEVDRAVKNAPKDSS